MGCITFANIVPLIFFIKFIDFDKRSVANGFYYGIIIQFNDVSFLKAYHKKSKKFVISSDLFLLLQFNFFGILN